MHLNRLSPILATVLAVSAVSLSASPHSEPPPAFTDAEHVYNGCHLSALAYLNRFSADFPAERGEPVVLVTAQPGGDRRAHTIAIVTWNGEWFARDEYLGVFRLGLNVDANPSIESLTTRADKTLTRLVERKSRAAGLRGFPGYRPAPTRRGELSPSAAAREVSAAARILHLPSTTYWVKNGKQEYPVLFFRPSPGSIAVYDPHLGTAVAECKISDDVEVVGLVATRLGYSAGYVRPAMPIASAVIASR